jgi:ribonuclease HI
MNNKKMVKRRREKSPQRKKKSPGPNKIMQSKKGCDEKKPKGLNHIYSDGNCKENGTDKARAGVGVCGTDFALGLKLPGVTQTNNRAELLGLFLAMLAADEKVETTIVTDSTYAIKVTNGEWKAKSNFDLVESCQAMYKRRPLVTFQWVKGHNGDEGNEQVDQLANQAILSPDPVTINSEL